MSDATYLLFAANSEGGSLRLEAITGLENAEARMKERAAARPADYFIYSFSEGVVVSRLRAPRPDREGLLLTGQQASS